MEPLPANVMYYVNQIAGYSKNTVKLQNINSNRAGPGAGASQTTVTMPTNSIINLESLALHAQFVGTGVASGSVNPPTDSAKPNAVYALCPRGGLSALAQRVSWAAGGIALDNGPTPYNVIHAIKNNTETCLCKMQSDQRVLNNSTISPYDVTTNVPAPAPTNLTGQTFDLICNEWLGFTQAAPCFLDTNLLPELRLTIQWESNDVLPVQYEGTVLGGASSGGNAPAQPPDGVSYSLDNMFWTVDVVSFSNGLLDAMNQRMMAEAGALSVVYPQYQVFSVDAVGPTSSVRGSASTMSLNRVYGAARKADINTPETRYSSNQPPVKCEDNVGFAFNNAFTNFFSDGLTEYQFKINNAPYPLYRESKLGGYNSIVTSNARAYSDSKGSIIGSRQTWENNCFSPCISLNHPADQRFISGLDLRSINSQINWDCFGSGSVGRQQILMTEQSSLMQIGGGRSLQIIA